MKKKMGKSVASIYFQIAFVLILLSSVLGVFAPDLISSKDTELVLLGFALCIVLPFIAGWLILNIYRKGKKVYEKCC
jgi:Na+/proline symporter